MAYPAIANPDDPRRNQVRIVHPEPADPQPSPVIELRGHLRLVGEVAAAGITPPPRWTQIETGLGRLQQAVAERPLLDELIAAVINNDADIAKRLAWANAEAAEQRAGVLAASHLHIHKALADAYHPQARKNYLHLAGRFNSAARRFTHLTKIVDVDSTGVDVVIGDKRALAAWWHAPDVAAELDNLVGPLTAAATLARRHDQPASLGSDRATFEIPLCCDVGHCHPRLIWLAWHQQTEVPARTDGAVTMTDLCHPALTPVEQRTGRWGAVIACGAVIEAADDPASVELFPLPASRYVQTADPSGRKITPTIIDPYDKPDTGSRLRRLFGRRTTPDQPEPNLAATVADATNEPGSGEWHDERAGHWKDVDR
jgi:hypothetical protein